MKNEKRKMKSLTAEDTEFHGGTAIFSHVKTPCFSVPSVFFFFPVLKKIILIFIVNIMVNVPNAQANEERPMRNVPPDARNVVSLIINPSSKTIAPRHNSLITETALEQQLTQHHIAQYTSESGIRLLNSVMDRAKIFMPFIRQEVEKRGLPPELAYLPIIESGFQITARSRSGAVGLWQFMLNSISPFDMRVTDLIDERRDFIKSTIGALQKLEDNYNALGSWELALAAYNAGLGAVNRIVQRTGISDYWELNASKQFRRETENFVPKLIAAAYVVSNPRKYGIHVWHEPFEWATIPLLRQVSVDIIAEEAGIDKNLLRQLNSQWLYGISPADTISRIVVPLDKFEEVSALLEREDIRLIRYNFHVVRQGDTLWAMSRRYGTPLNMIEQHNPGVSNRYLRLGETIIIPILE